MRQQLIHIGCPRLSIARELAGSEKQTRCPVAQDVAVLNLFASEFRHGHRIHFWRRRLTAAQQLAGILAAFSRAAEVFAKAPGLQLHRRAALVAVDDGAVVALDLELAVLNLKARAVRVVPAHVKLALFVDQVAVHGSIAQWAAALAAQQARFCFVIRVVANSLVTGHKVDGVLTALLGRQCVA